MYKILFSDLDETLLVNHHVPSFNQGAIRKARQKGVRFVVATGRSYNMIQEILQEVGTYNQEGEYAICFNGGLIIENKNNRILHFKGLEEQLAKALFERGRFLDVCVLVFTLDCCYIYHPDENEIERKKAQKAPFQVMDKYDFDILKGQKIAKILFMKRDMDYLRDVKNILEKDFSNVSFSFSSNRYIEMNAKGIDKGYGISWLCDYLKIDLKDAIAIGDNYNDVPMIKKAGVGCCVQSSFDDIKSLSDYVCEKDYFEGSVKEVIEKLIED
ncbi:Cof-type HAD-IIB family hydrolase [Sharpea azabuensis]|uniref:Cof-type HAD-IIB family hydrolase n=1 Tax=Sharpea azabuensis TaxID=322505 RepID=UPI00156B1447|nr:Cof-type HAD-IIB family hydrolase [Sharpea azabuensis]